MQDFKIRLVHEFSSHFNFGFVNCCNYNFVTQHVRIVAKLQFYYSGKISLIISSMHYKRTWLHSIQIHTYWDVQHELATIFFSVSCYLSQDNSHIIHKQCYHLTRKPYILATYICQNPHTVKPWTHAM